MLICLLYHAVNPCRRNILFHYHLLTANFIIMVILTISKAIQIAGKLHEFKHARKRQTLKSREMSAGK